MTSEVAGSAWRARYDDLAGKVAVVTGDHDALAAVVEALASNGMAIAIVSSARNNVDAAVASTESSGVAVFGVKADPGAPATWVRVVAHSEQRLGPLDVLVVLGPPSSRTAAISAIAPDMAVRRRGVVIEVGSRAEDSSPPAGVRHRTVTAATGSAPGDVAAAVALCASDVLAASQVAIKIG